jgi:hypothetical protein
MHIAPIIISSSFISQNQNQYLGCKGTKKNAHTQTHMHFLGLKVKGRAVGAKD